MRKDWGKRGKRLEIYLHFNRNLSRERLKITFIGNFIDALVSIALQSSGIRNCINCFSFSPPIFLFLFGNWIIDEKRD